MGILLLFILIILAIIMCKNNFKKRTEELTNNLKNFNEEIKSIFYSTPEVYQEKLLNLLTSESQANLKSILNGNFAYGANAWSIQQQMLKQQELLIELNNLRRKDLFI
ncbi:hypothetical protein HBE96_16320 [Clostridium sp. P21]|uniref:Uncharacterized protein n=1 Tax=Clostridium muellerianum TaxID=2716538 RepID=A0A7Y0EIT5_9CLOT|nr:hypothetical protein [Clostridium muellerianum]NMM64192.1 hypothetical protein [Clostridium muellerianum]